MTLKKILGIVICTISAIAFVEILMWYEGVVPTLISLGIVGFIVLLVYAIQWLLSNDQTSYTTKRHSATRRFKRMPL